MFNDTYNNTLGAIESDYLLGGELPKLDKTFADYRIQYNQNETSLYSCTVISCLTAISNLTGYKFTLQERRNLWNEAIKQGAKEGFGWVTQKAVDLTRKYFNNLSQNKDNQIYSFRVDFHSKGFFNALEKGYTLVIGGHINRNYWNDVFSDGVLDKYEQGKGTFGHVFSITKLNKDFFVIENYVNHRKHNKILVSKNFLDNLKNQSNNNIYFFSSAYVFAFVNTYTHQVSSWAETAKEWAELKGIIKNWETPQEIIGTEKLEYILENLGVLDKNVHQGNVNLERFAVALFRLLS